MEIVFYSQTRQTRRFVEKLMDTPGFANQVAYEIQDDMVMGRPYILLTPTYMAGQIPNPVYKFLMNPENSRLLRGVVSSGNRNWGPNFAKAGDRIAEWLGVPLLHKYEQRGNNTDLKIVVDKIKQLKEEVV